MSPTSADRANIAPFIVMDVMRAAAAREATGRDVLHLEVGQPSTAAPRPVLEAARSALETDRLGYTLAFGIPDLRRAIAGHYRSRQGLDVDPDRIVVTTGSSGAFVLSFLSCFSPGDRVAQAVPGYPAYRNTLSALGAVPVDIPVGPEEHFQPTPEQLDREPGLAGLILASPANPTGSVIDPGRLRALVDYCADRGLWLISDEIYHGITYGAETATVLAMTDAAVVINSFSKYFSMTGWRLGWMVLPESLLRPVECLAQNLFISSPTLSQQSAVAVFDCYGDLDANVARYARNREVLLRELPKAGFSRLAPPDGAFYLYADVSEMTDDSTAFSRRMLDETGVATTPGTDFDPGRGHQFLRFSYAGSTADMEEAARRLIRWRTEL